MGESLIAKMNLNGHSENCSGRFLFMISLIDVTSSEETEELDCIFISKFAVSFKEN